MSDDAKDPIDPVVGAGEDLRPAVAADDGKLSPGDPSLSFARQPVLNKRAIKVILVALAGLVVLAIVIGFSPARRAVQGAGKPTPARSDFAAREPGILTIGPEDYAPSKPASAATAYRRYDRLEPTGAVGLSSPGAARGARTISARAAGGDAELLAERELEEAATSGLFFPVAQAGAQAAASLSPGAGASDDARAIEAASASDYDKQNQAKEKREFLASERSDYSAYLDNSVLLPVDPAHEIEAGTLIPITMITGIDSDLPGDIIAQVTENVYDSVTGANLLVPMGSRVLGEYDNGVAFGQNRVLLAWSRLILPDGASIELRGMDGADLEGRSGLADRVNYHLKQILAGVGLATVFDLGTDAALSALTTSQFLQSLASAMTANGSASSDAGSETQQIVIRYADKLIDEQPTILVRPGFRANVIVNRDIILPGYPSPGGAP